MPQGCGCLFGVEFEVGVRSAHDSGFRLFEEGLVYCCFRILVWGSGCETRYFKFGWVGVVYRLGRLVFA